MIESLSYFNLQVDQAVSMAFGECRTSNYVRIQANESLAKKHGGLKKGINCSKNMDILGVTENMLEQKNVESVLFKGKKMVESTNLEKLELFGGELIKEQERRKTSILPIVTLKHTSPSPRTSSATTLSTLSSCQFGLLKLKQKQKVYQAELNYDASAAARDE